MVKPVTLSDFSSQVIEASRTRPVLVDFWATWCQPCAMLSPILEQLEQEYAGRISIVKVDTDAEAGLAMDYMVRSLPTVKLFVHGEVVGEFSGVLPPEEIRRFLDEHLPRSSDSDLEKAMDLAERGDPQQALAMLRGAIESDPENYRLHSKLAALLIEHGRLDEAESVIKTVPANLECEDPFTTLAARIRLARIAGKDADTESLRESLSKRPEDLDLRLRLGAREALNGEYEASMSELMEVIRSDRAFGDDAGRRTLLDVFSILDKDDPLVRKYRSRLSAALN